MIKLLLIITIALTITGWWLVAFFYRRLARRKAETKEMLEAYIELCREVNEMRNRAALQQRIALSSINRTEDA